MIERHALWDMQIFVASVDGGSIAAGARAEGVTASAASKRIAALEERLGVRLLQRTTRSLRVTDEGARYLERARGLLAEVGALESSVREQRGALRGEVRLSAPTLLGQELVTRIVARFSIAHPEVTVHLTLSDRFVDLVSEPFDLAVRIADRLRGSELVVRQAGTMASFVVASPAYLDRRGRPTTIDELSAHAVLELEHAVHRGQWRLTMRGEARSIPVRGPLVCSSLAGIRHATLEGLGIALLPAYLVSDDLREGRLVRLFPSSWIERRQVFLVQPSRTYVPMRVRALADAIVRELPRRLAPR